MISLAHLLPIGFALAVDLHRSGLCGRRKDGQTFIHSFQANRI
jgi:hypothetical protein